MPLLLRSPRSPLAYPLRLRSSSAATCFLLRSEHRPGARRLHAIAALAVDNRVVVCARALGAASASLLWAYGSLTPTRRMVCGADQLRRFLLRWLQLGFGLVTLDYLATVDAYPRPDDKIRTGELQISGGGNAGNALTAAARLGLNTRVVSKVGNDQTGGTVLSELNEAGIDTSHVIISGGGNTSLVYIIIDKQTKTRTCILTPGEPQMVPSDLPMSSLSAALQNVSLLYIDGYSPGMALIVAKQK